jgi:hypothetical protein
MRVECSTGVVRGSVSPAVVFARAGLYTCFEVTIRAFKPSIRSWRVLDGIDNTTRVVEPVRFFSSVRERQHAVRNCLANACGVRRRGRGVRVVHVTFVMFDCSLMFVSHNTPLGTEQTKFQRARCAWWVGVQEMVDFTMRNVKFAWC